MPMVMPMWMFFDSLVFYLNQVIYCLISFGNTGVTEATIVDEWVGYLRKEVRLLVSYLIFSKIMN